MPVRRLSVTRKKPSTGRLPEWATQYVVLLESLRARGLLEAISERLHVARRDGYSALDVFLFLLLYFSSSCRCGLRSFSDRCRPYARELAAVAGRHSWPTQSSVSRFLSLLDPEQVGAFGDWLLSAGSYADTLEQSAVIVHRDACGQAWHVFDYDPTVETLRQRALPTSDDEPAPQRRSARLAAPGYPGRKRGEVQISRATLQHAGSALWLSIRVGPGNGEHRGHLQAAVTAVVAWCARTMQPLARVVFRSDGGAGGSVPAITLCREAGVPHLSRLARYEVLAWPDVIKALADATWCKVADSGSGPQREAAELGTLCLAAGKASLREDGQPYAPVQTRVVVSRFPASAHKRGAGVVRDGWHYELYATDLPAAEWPADEVVTCYYGRCGQENRFYQEDQELALGRIFNYTPAGQAFANLVGLWVWNQGICRGLELSSPLPTTLPSQRPRVTTVTPPPETVSVLPHDDESPVAMAPPAAASLTGPSALAAPASPAATAPATCATDDPGQGPLQPEMLTLLGAACPDEPSAADDATARPRGAGSSTTVAAPSPHESPTITAVTAATTPAVLKALCLAALITLDWRRRLATLPHWRYDAVGGLRCPRDHGLRLHSAALVGHSVAVTFRARRAACRDCPTRCTPSSSPTFCKELLFSLPLASLGPIPTATRLPAQRVPTIRSAPPSPPLPPRWRPTPNATRTGPLQAAPPALVPSVLRHRLTYVCMGIDVHVNVNTPRRSRPHRVDYCADGPRERQHRRLTWKARFHRNELPDQTVLDVRLVGGQRLRPLLRATIGGASS